MSWQQIIGHDEIAARFARAAERGRVDGSYLFIGQHGIGKRTFAIALAKTLLCHNCAENFVPCGVCRSCVLFGSEITHPDFFYISKPPDKTALPLELIIGSRERRGHDGLCHDIALTSSLGGKKIAIIDDADTLLEEAANSLLKTLEEPPTSTVMILLGTSPAKILPTIRSRCRIVRFAQPTSTAPPTDAALEDERREILAMLASPTMSRVALASRLNEMVERAGKEAIHRRRRLRYFFEAICDSDRLLIRSNQQALPRLERTLDAIEQLDRNATPAYLLDAWALDLPST